MSTAVAFKSQKDEQRVVLTVSSDKDTLYGDSREEIIANLNQAANDIKMIRDGKLEGRPIEELLNEL